MGFVYMNFYRPSGLFWIYLSFSLVRLAILLKKGASENITINITETLLYDRPIRKNTAYKTKKIIFCFFSFSSVSCILIISGIIASISFFSLFPNTMW